MLLSGEIMRLYLYYIYTTVHIFEIVDFIDADLKFSASILDLPSLKTTANQYI